VKTQTQYWLCHFDDGSGCWIWEWRGSDLPSRYWMEDGCRQRDEPRTVLPPAEGPEERRIPRVLARCLIRSWRRRGHNTGIMGGK